MKRVFIVTESHLLHDGIAALMEAIPWMKVISEVGSPGTALEIDQCGCPDLIVLDMGLSHNSGPAVLTWLKTHCPETRCMSLADDLQQQAEAANAGADIVLPKGYPAAGLITIVEDLFSGRNREDSASC